MADQSTTQQCPSDGGPAFPTTHNHANVPDWTTVGGISIRDYFAAKAMEGFIANPVLENVRSTKNEWGKLIIDEDKIARCAYAVADAMLKAR